MTANRTNLRRAIAAILPTITFAGLTMGQGEEVETLEAFTDTAQVDVNNVIPDIDIGGILGPTGTPLETPRSVSVISDEIIERYGIQSTRDFISVVPGAFTPSNYGVDGGLRLRGEDGELYFRGFKKLQNSALYPTPLAATDRIEVVRGPAAVVHGASRNSGYLNFVPRTARTEQGRNFEAAFGEAQFTFGSWDKKNASIEYGFPFKTGEQTSSALVYLEREDSGSFYENDLDRWWVLQAGTDIVFSDNFRIETGFMYFDWEGKNNIGWNRVTQDLVDNGRYLSGTVPDIAPPGANALTAGDFAAPLGWAPFPFPDPANQLGSNYRQFYLGGFFPGGGIEPPDDPNSPGQSLWRIENPAFTTLDPSETLVDTIDYIWLENFTGYFDLVFETPNLVVKNQTFLDTYKTENYVSYGFGGYFDSTVIENRTTAAFDLSLGENIESSHIVGFSYRYFDGLSEQSFGQGYQHADRRDLSQGATPSDRYVFPLDDPTRFGFVAGSKGQSVEEDTEYLDMAPFISSRFAYNDLLFLDTGIRWQYFDAESIDRGVFTSVLEADDEALLGSYNISLSANLNNIRPYVTFANTPYLVSDGNGGTLAPANIESGQYIADAEMFEVGVKASLMEGKLYAALAYYDQTNSRTDQTGLPVEVQSEGVELEVRWAPTSNFSMTGTATWVDSVQIADAFIRVPLSEVNRSREAGGLTPIAPEDYYGGIAEAVLSTTELGLEQDVTGQPDYVYPSVS